MVDTTEETERTSPLPRNADRRYKEPTSLKNKVWFNELIGEGAYGQVFRGRLNGEDVVVKKCELNGKQSIDPIEEAEILKKLNKRIINVVKFYGYYVENECCYMVMEYCKEGSIYDYVKRVGRMNEKSVRQVAIDVIEALSQIHKHGYLHRDVSPKNVVISKFDENYIPRVKLIDFGLSKSMDKVQGTMCGTPGFQDTKVLKLPKQGKELDYHSLGCVIIYMLTKKIYNDHKERLRYVNGNEIHKDVKNIMKQPFITEPLIERLKTTERKRSLSRQPSQRQAFSVPTNCHRTNSALTIDSHHPHVDIEWPLKNALMDINKNIKNKGRIIFNSQGRYVAFEFASDSTLECVVRVERVGQVNQKVEVYVPRSGTSLRLKDYANEVPNSKLKLRKTIRSPRELSDVSEAQKAYKLISKAAKDFGDMVVSEWLVHKTANQKYVVNKAKYPSLVEAFRVTVKDEGLRGMVRGWSPTAIGYGAQGFAKFGFYEAFKQMFFDNMNPENAYVYRTAIFALAAAFAESIGDVLLAPFEAMKVRTQTDPLAPPAMRHCLPMIWKSEGVSGFFKGLIPLWSRQIPYTVSKFVAFEFAIDFLYRYFKLDRQTCDRNVQLSVSLVAGILAGCWSGLGARVFMIGSIASMQLFTVDSVKMFFHIERPKVPEPPPSLLNSQLKK
ncbi:Phosphate carrier protein, mitochondrial [Aphelenchoides besseyi]|nr:Phosphate carrier protein, mitochondrial [Aphelenchoides besseyi]